MVIMIANPQIVLQICSLLLGLQLTAAKPISLMSGGSAYVPHKPTKVNAEIRKKQLISDSVHCQSLEFSKKIRKNATQTFESPFGLMDLQFVTIKNPVYRLSDTRRKRTILPREQTQINTEESKIIIWEVEAEMNEDPKNWKIFYWVGENSTAADAGDVAFYAMQLDSEIHPITRIYREAEGQESRDFKVLFEKIRTNQKSTEKPPSKKINYWKAKRLFLVKGKSRPYFKEVEVSLENLTHGDCVVFLSRKVHVYCKDSATKVQRDAAENLATFALQKKGLSKQGIIYHRSMSGSVKENDAEPCPTQDTSCDELVWKLLREERKGIFQFLDEIERTSKRPQPIINNIDQFKPEEVRSILGQTSQTFFGTELFHMKIIRVYEKYDSLQTSMEDQSYIFQPLVLLNNQSCYLIDSQSNAGLFVWIGREANKEIRRSCARKAERDLREKNYHGKHGHLPNSVTYIHQDDVPDKIDNIQSLVSDFNPTVQRDNNT